MQKPVIASLGTKERQELITHIEQNLLNSTDKEVIVEALKFKVLVPDPEASNLDGLTA